MLYKLTSFTGWLIFIGFYFLIYYYGTPTTSDWASSNADLVMMWLLSSFILTCFFETGHALNRLRFIRARSYGLHILVRVLSVLTGFLIIGVVTRISAYYEGAITAAEILPTLWQKLTQKDAVSVIGYVILTAAVLSFIRQMSYMLGPRVLINLMRGKYHIPREENRVFMFMDMRGSTTHAERLGHVKFSKLIQDCFHDLTDSALKHEVEIYQYVGDEAILTWSTRRAKKNGNCIQVFWNFEQRLKDNKEYYVENYGFLPEFKAGVNAGLVTVAEIGDIKRDIAYLSDVLNTAARIEGVCNKVGKNILISSSVRELLDGDANMQFTSLGDVMLEGKEGQQHIYHVEAA